MGEGHVKQSFDDFIVVEDEKHTFFLNKAQIVSLEVINNGEQE